MRSKILVASAVVASVFLFPASAWATISFGASTQFPAGLNPLSVATGDFNGDGDPDVVTANLNSGTVSVLLNDGSGGLGLPTPVTADTGPCGLAVKDLNGDGNLDIAVANRGSNTVSVVLGDGNGAFAAAAGSPFVVGAFPLEVAIGDVDGNGDDDLVVPNWGGNNLTVLEGDGTGGFAEAAGSPYATGSEPRDIALADFDDDGDLDAVSNSFNADSAYVNLNNGSGVFTAPVIHAVDNAPDEVATADFNGDGDVDILTANRGPSNAGTVSLLAGNGDGTFHAAVNFATGHGLSGIAVGDLDGDGILDVATSSDLDHVVDILPGTGGGAVGSVITSSVGEGASHLVIDDLDSDGKPDLVTADFTTSTATVLLNTSVSAFTTGPTASISGTVRQGQTLTADEGSPDPTPDSLAYTWFADGAEIVGETASTLLLTAAQVSKKISVEITASKAGLTDASDTSPETAAVQGIFVPGPKASISGYARVGATLTASAGSSSPTPSIIGYRWFADGVQLSNVTRTLKLTTAHRGKRIQVKVFAIKAGYLTATSLSAATARVSSLQAKTISMELNDYTVRRGQTVRAEIELLAAGEPWKIILDGKTVASGNANAQGIAVKYFTIPTNATLGIRTIRAYGLFPDRTDPDRITVR